MKSGARRIACILTLVPLTSCRSHPLLTNPTDPPLLDPAVKVVDIVPASLSSEDNQDSEPFLSVDITNPQVMVASAFTPNPFSPTGNAPVYITQDGGNTWFLNAITPVKNMTCDITHAMVSAQENPRGDLHSGTLACVANDTELQESKAADVSSPTVMSVKSARANVDQPFVKSLTISGNDRIYVGVNDFNQPNGHTATVDVSLNGGSTYRSFPIEARNTLSQDGPSVRPAIARDGVVYAAFFGWRSSQGTMKTSDLVVVRDDNGASGSSAFQDLKDPADNLPGRIVVSGRKIPFSNAPTLGQERIGSTLSIAVDPNHSEIVYLGWADRVKSNDYTLHVRRSIDKGATWSSADLPNTTITNATNIALSISDTGAVGMLFQQLASGRWKTIIRQSKDGFNHVQDTLLATVPGNVPVGKFLPYLGDYDCVFAVGTEFRGIFAANNTPDNGNFPNGVKYQRLANFTNKTLSDSNGNNVNISIDPFYFSVPVMQ